MRCTHSQTQRNRRQLEGNGRCLMGPRFSIIEWRRSVCLAQQCQYSFHYWTTHLKTIKGRYWEKGHHCPPFVDPDDSTRLQWIVPISWLNRIALLNQMCQKAKPKRHGFGKGPQEWGRGLLRMGINKRGWGKEQSEYIICTYEMVKEQNLIKKSQVAEDMVLCRLLAYHEWEFK